MKVVTQNGEFDLGVTETTPTIGITDFSRRVTDDFGVTTVVERGFSRRMSVKLALATDAVDTLQQRLADLRASTALWVADDRFVWLSLYGFYKDFDVDLAVPPLSRCTLTVDGLAETGGVADSGADPALGQASSLQLLQPFAVTDAMLAGSTVAEDDAGAWASGATYAKGARTVRAHRVYESLIASNTGKLPESEPAWWLDVGPTNRWAMFDEALGTATSKAGGFNVTLNGGAANALALIDVVGTSVRVQANGYDQSQLARPGAIVFTGLPGSGQVTVTIAGAQAAVGTLLIGRMVGLGVTEASPTAGITDFSRKVVDDFGAVTVVQRAYSKRMTARSMIRTDAIDVVADRIAAVRARPSLWIGQAGQDAITIYGFFKEFSIEVDTHVSKLSLSIEGLSKAAPATPAAAPLVPRGDYDPAVVYAAGALVQYQGATWRYINSTPASGYAPPTLPTTTNDFWTIFGTVGMTPEQQEAMAALLARVNAIGSDNVLSAGSEKQQVIIDWNTLYQDLESLYGKYVALGSPADLTFYVSSASNYRQQLASYLGQLAPPWNQISVDTPIVSAEWSGKWQNAYAYINDLRAQIAGRKGDPGTDAKLLTLRSDSQQITYDGAGVINPTGQVVQFNADRQNTTAPIRWFAFRADGVKLNAVNVLFVEGRPFSDNGDGTFGTTYGDVKMRWQEFETGRGSTEGVTIQAIVTDGAQIVAQQSIKRLVAGRNGLDGTNGLNGTNGQSIHIAYADSADGTVNFTIGAAGGRSYIGVYTDTNPGTDSSNPASYGWTLIRGANGNNGLPGPGGYVHIAYADSADGTVNFHLSDPSGRRYLGTYTDQSAPDSPSPASYAWSLIKGADGAPGGPGASGPPALSLTASAPSLSFAADYLGNLKSGQLAQVIVLSFLEGPTNVSSSVDWSTPEFSGCTGSMTSAGLVTFTSVIANGYFRVNGTYKGTTLPINVPIALMRDTPPANSDQQVSIGTNGFSISSNSYPASPYITVTASIPSGTLRGTMDVSYSAGGQGNVYLEGMLGYRIAGTNNAWSFMPAVAGTQARINNNNASEPINDQGIISSVQTVGVSPGRYEVGIFLRRYQGAQTGITFGRMEGKNG